MGDVNDARGVARLDGHSIQYQPVIAWPCRTNGGGNRHHGANHNQAEGGRVMEPRRASLLAAGISLAILLAPLSAKADLLGDVSACATRADPVTVRTPRSCAAQRAAIGFGRTDTLAQSMPPARKRYSVKKTCASAPTPAAGVAANGIVATAAPASVTMTAPASFLQCRRSPPLLAAPLDTAN
jgi:hypothetical protein